MYNITNKELELLRTLVLREASVSRQKVQEGKPEYQEYVDSLDHINDKLVGVVRERAKTLEDYDKARPPIVFYPKRAVSAKPRTHMAAGWYTVTMEDGSECFQHAKDEPEAVQETDRREIHRASYDNEKLRDAYLNEPEGRKCGHCGKDNDFADDCGFWYIEAAPPGEPYVPGEGTRKWEMKPCCRACYDGPVGQRHTTKYGVGDR